MLKKLVRKFFKKKINPNLKIKYKIRINKKLKKNDIIFFHIGKTAGTKINLLFKKNVSENINIIKTQHDLKKRHINLNQKYFFSIRSPINRFVSGFYSRKKKGQPRIYKEWSAEEKIAFKKFKSANQLAESLFLKNKKGQDAIRAIQSIEHCNSDQIDWFSGSDFFGNNPPLSIIRHEFFEHDIILLCKKLNIKKEILKKIKKEIKIKEHYNNYNKIKPLSKKAIFNLKKWYVKDVYFYKYCNDLIKKNK
jgi:hypothetical protein